LLIIARNIALILKRKILEGKHVKEKGTLLSSSIKDITSVKSIERKGHAIIM